AASMAFMPDVGPVDSLSGLNLRTCPLHMRYVVSLDSSHHPGSYSKATSFVRSPTTDALVVTVTVTTTVDADVAAGSKAKDVSKGFENIGDSTSAEMDLFAFIRHSDPTKVQIGERELVGHEVKLLKITEGRTVPLSPPVTTTPKDSGDSFDKLFDDADQEHVIPRSDDVLEEAIAKDASEVVAEQPHKKRKRKVTGNASTSAYPPKKLRDDYQSLPPTTSKKSLAALLDMILKGSDLPSSVTEPLIAASMAFMPDVGPVDSLSGLNLRTCPLHMRELKNPPIRLRDRKGQWKEKAKNTPTSRC
nr:hypothetical protein [Tanacetum cinerariifolium]